jgi:FG-GAP repeat protein
VPGAKMSLAQAPAGLRAVVRRTVRAPAAAGSAFQQAKLTASDGAPDDGFGVSVAISGSTAVVGASFKNSQTGAAYVFVRTDTAWSQQAKLTAPGPATIDFFGWSVAIVGSTAVVGAPGQTSPGAAYVFVRSGTAWHRQAKLTAVDGASGDFFGGSVALSESTAVAGAPNNNSAIGAAYVYVNV